LIYTFYIYIVLLRFHVCTIYIYFIYIKLSKNLTVLVFFFFFFSYDIFPYESLLIRTGIIHGQCLNIHSGICIALDRNVETPNGIICKKVYIHTLYTFRIDSTTSSPMTLMTHTLRGSCRIARMVFMPPSLPQQM
jgi:hypothetical protein